MINYILVNKKYLIKLIKHQNIIDNKCKHFNIILY